MAPIRPLPRGSASVHFSEGWSYHKERAGENEGVDSAAKANEPNAAAVSHNRKARCMTEQKPEHRLAASLSAGENFHERAAKKTAARRGENCCSQLGHEAHPASRAF